MYCNLGHQFFVFSGPIFCHIISFLHICIMMESLVNVKFIIHFVCVWVNIHHMRFLDYNHIEYYIGKENSPNCEHAKNPGSRIHERIFFFFFWKKQCELNYMESSSYRILVIMFLLQQQNTAIARYNCFAKAKIKIFLGKNKIFHT